MNRVLIAIPAAVLLAACTPAVTAAPPAPASFSPDYSAEIAYLRSHPVPVPAGFTAGIVESDSVSAPEPPVTGGGSWSQRLVTRSGAILTVRCPGPCSWGPPFPLGVAGINAYELARSNGDASRPGDIRVITLGAVSRP